ncbi:pyrroline-5-carboxylate reductase [Aeromicrobium tamlense]|uniref:Pyrroline-5-carboxylate reductase n=1 Tax=Aeromicrobium tamlense TaxID=375541 RepID=A0A8I0FUV2_9ACTN|nr:MULTISPECIES: pyrroline-5-carboxylate reductase [Aeromicrobium]MBD1269396.1 pyrroline-5-carboxylate reductase [Aeromicrobium tamlense]NYI36696.1 pyrroline-5-carboxylate reductase [Aeromicrobium tamlense]
MRIAVIGGGVMGGTLAEAMARAGRDDIVVVERSAERRAELEARGHETSDDVAAVAGAEMILLVVKPQDVASVLPEISAVAGDGATVVSLAAGVRTATIEAALPEGVAVVRAMPNTPAVIGRGMFGVSPGSRVPVERLDAVVDLLRSGGEVVVVDESHQDAVTAVSGSGPAYLFHLAEHMIAAGIEGGLDPEAARALTVQTLVGASELLAGSDESPEELRRRVTSPNGTTHAAITTFDQHGVGEGIRAGVLAAIARSAELG